MSSRMIARSGPVRLRAAWLLFWATSLLAAVASAAASDAGTGQLRWQAHGVEMVVFTYRPPACAKPSILFVFHGLNRKAESLRTKAMDVAMEQCLMVFAPLFDEARFPNWRYHRAGVVKNGRVQPEDQWTAPVLRELLELARNEVGNSAPKLYLFGHSAGGQFLSRIAAYTPLKDVERIVIANPSAYVAPLLDESAPYGFKGVMTGEDARVHLQAYLEAPITIYLGQEDKGEKYLAKDTAAMRQGENRLERGRTIFAMAEEVSRERGWHFGWTLIEAPGVGHSSGGMLRAPAVHQALGLSP